MATATSPRSRNIPVFRDSAKFKGEIIHTSNLDDSRTFEGKKVVLVGSGSTSICCAPELSKTAQSLVLLQRSPSYIYEITNRAGLLILLCQNLYRLGLRAPVRWLRRYLQFRDDVIFVGFRRFPSTRPTILPAALGDHSGRGRASGAFQPELPTPGNSALRLRLG